MKNFLLSLFFLFFISLFAYSINIEKEIILNYQDTTKTYINDQPYLSNTFYYELKIYDIKRVNYDTYYSFNFSLKNMVVDTKQNEDTINIVRILTKGFKTQFTTDQNLNFLYSPNIEYLYLSDPLYQKYKEKIDKSSLNEFANSVFYSFFDWFGKLKNKCHLELVEHSFDIYLSLFYYDSNYTTQLNIGKKGYKALVIKGQGKVEKISKGENLFNGLSIFSSNVNTYEYYDQQTLLPLLLQREIMIRFDFNDPKMKQEYFKKYQKTYIDYKITKTLMLIYSNNL
ncbi:MAG: hypothetical protein QXI58_05465 [Candidatus Micrarchaeia archaeon]